MGRMRAAPDMPVWLQWVTGALQASVAAALLSIAAIAIIKEGFEDSSRMIVLNRTFLGVVTAVYSALLVAFTAMQVRVLWRVRQSLRLGRSWSRRRVVALRAAVPHALCIFALLVIATGGSAAYLANPELLCFPTWPCFAAQYVATLAWNVELLLLAVDGHNVMLLDKHDALSERMVADLPARRHWKKVVFITLPLLGAPPLCSDAAPYVAAQRASASEPRSGLCGQLTRERAHCRALDAHACLRSSQRP